MDTAHRSLITSLYRGARIASSVAISLFVVSILLGVGASTAHAEGSDPIACPLEPQEGRTIVQIFEQTDRGIRSDKNESHAVITPFSLNTSIAAGTYDVVLASYDDHDEKSGQSQPHEEWKLDLELSDGSTYQSEKISDIPDDQNYVTEKVGSGVVFNSDIVKVGATHAAYPSSNPNSHVPICAAFDKNEPEVTTGSIQVCKVAADEQGNIFDAGGTESSFVVSLFDDIGMQNQNEVGVADFSTPLEYTQDLLNSNGPDNDVECTTIDDLDIGDYYYDEEVIYGNGWSTVRYDDQFNTPAQTLDDFQSYDNHLFDDNASNDEDRNKDVDGHIRLTKERPDRTLVVLNTQEEPEPTGATISASKVVCEDESQLPNWSAGSVDITASTAQDWVDANASCELASGWDFQWQIASATNPGDNKGEVGGFNTFGPTNQDGVATATIDASTTESTSHIWVREVTQEEFVDFSGMNGSNQSAEMWCHTDVRNYDNFDRIDDPQAGSTYHCVAFNAQEEQEPPMDPAQCPYTQEDGTVVEFDGGIRSDKTEAHAHTATTSISLSAGNYRVQLYSYDASSQRVGQSQPQERWFAQLFSGNTSIANTGTSTDLADNQAVATSSDTVNTNLHISAGVDNVRAYHAAYPSSNPNSVYPVCAAFEKVDERVEVHAEDDTATTEENTAVDIDVLANDLGDGISIMNLTNPSDGTVATTSTAGEVRYTPDTDFVGTGTFEYTIEDTHGATSSATVTVTVEEGDGEFQCSDLEGKNGWYGEYFNYPSSHEDMEVPNSQWNDDHGDPLSDEGTWMTDWYQEEYYRFARIDEDITFGGGFFPFSGDKIEEETDGRDFHFGTHWSAMVTASTTRTYSYSLASDDDAWVYLDGDLIVDNAGIHAAQNKIGSVNISAGIHTVDIYFAERHTRQSHFSFEFTDPYLTIEPHAQQCDDDGGGGNGGGQNSGPTAEDDTATTTRDTAIDIDVLANDTDPDGDTLSITDLGPAATGTVATTTTSGVVSFTPPTDFVGTSTFPYTIDDGHGHQDTATVNIVVRPYACEDGQDNDGDGKVDKNDPGCHTDNDPNDGDDTYNPKDDNEKDKKKSTTNGGGSGGGGGGGGFNLRITNEDVRSGTSTGSAVVTWDTNTGATSRVVYGTSSVSSVDESEDDYGYTHSTGEVDNDTEDHTMNITGLEEGVTYYFRPVSDTSFTSEEVGDEVSLSFGQIASVQTAAGTASCEPYLDDFLKRGWNNDPVEVLKLQAFLNTIEGYSEVELSGEFDQTTFDAVEKFQQRYSDDVLNPWGYGEVESTGFVYITTRNKINEIICNTDIPLTAAQQQEIDSYREGPGRQYGVGGADTTPGGEVGGVDAQSGGTIGAETDPAEGVGEQDSGIAGTTTTATSGVVVVRNSARNVAAAVYTSVNGIIGAVIDFIFSWCFLLLLIGILIGLVISPYTYGDQPDASTRTKEE